MVKRPPKANEATNSTKHITVTFFDVSNYLVLSLMRANYTFMVRSAMRNSHLDYTNTSNSVHEKVTGTAEVIMNYRSNYYNAGNTEAALAWMYKNGDSATVVQYAKNVPPTMVKKCLERVRIKLITPRSDRSFRAPGQICQRCETTGSFSSLRQYFIVLASPGYAFSNVTRESERSGKWTKI